MGTEIFKSYTERYSVKSLIKKELTNDHKQKVRDEDIFYTNDDLYSDKIYNTSYNVDGNVGYMCPNCFNVEHIKTKIDNSAKLIFDHVTDDEITDIEAEKIRLSVDYKIDAKCPVCKYYKSHIKLDDNIADTIGILNIKGYKTSSSCEGRKTVDGIIDPYIGFNTLFTHYSIKTLPKIESYIENTLPLSWYVDRPNYITSYSMINPDMMLQIPHKHFIPPYIIYHFMIKSDYWNKEEALADILKWARSLADITNGGII